MTAESGPRAATLETRLVGLRRARDTIDRDYGAGMRIGALAAAAGLSPSQFIRSFTASYGQTPGRYLTWRRMERARDLLRRTSMPVTDVAVAVGFASLGSFCWRFARSVGHTPLEYRRLFAREAARTLIPGCFTLMWGSGLDPVAGGGGRNSEEARPPNPGISFGAAIGPTGRRDG